MTVSRFFHVTVLLLTVHCSLFTRLAWALDFYVNDCCTRNDVYTFDVDADGATGNDTLACAAYQDPRTPARSIREILVACAADLAPAGADRIFVDTGFYLSRQFTVDCSVVDTAAACEINTADPGSVAPWNDAGTAGDHLIQVANVAIIGVPFRGGTVVDGHGATNGGSERVNVFYIDGPGGASDVRIQNLDIYHGQRGIFIDNANNILIEGVTSRDHTGGPKTGIEEQLGSNNYFRNIILANNGDRGLALLGVDTVMVENGTFYLDGNAANEMEILVGAQGGTDSTTVTVRNSTFVIETGSRRGIVVNDGSQTNFRSNFNVFIREAAGAQVGRWRGTNATTLADWQDWTLDNAVGGAASCPVGATKECKDGDAAADRACDCNSGSEIGGSLEDYFVDRNDRDWHIIGRYGHLDEGEPTWFDKADADGDGNIDEGPMEIFSWSDDIAYTVSPVDAGCNVNTVNSACGSMAGIGPGGAGALSGERNPLEFEGNGDRPNAEGNANRFAASRAGFTFPLTAAVVQGALGDPDLIGGTPPTRSMGALEPAVQVTLTHTGGAANSDTLILGDLAPADTCANAGPGPSYLQITDGVDTMIAYLSDMQIAAATDWCLDPGDPPATLYFQAYRPMPEGFYNGDYFATLVLRGWMFIKEHLDNAAINTATIFRTFIQNAPRLMWGGTIAASEQNRAAYIDGLVPLPDQAVITSNKWNVRGGGVATGDPARPIYVPGCFDATNAGANPNNTAFVIRAGDGTADNIAVRVCENGSGTFTLSASVGLCDGASDSYVLITDMNGGTYRTCSATAGLVSACALGTTCAASSTAVTFNTGGDMGALCNGPATVELGLYDGAAVTTRTIPEPVYIVDSATANCRTSRIQYVQGSRTVATFTSGVTPFDMGMNVRTVWNDRGTIEDNPANTFSGVTIMDAEAQAITDLSPRVVSAYCDPAADSCNGAVPPNPLQVGENFLVAFDDPNNDGNDDPPVAVPPNMCNGTAELRLNIRGTEGADPADALNENPTVVDPVAISGGYDCLTCMAQTLEFSAGGTDTSSAGDNRIAAQAGAAVTTRAQLYNTGSGSFSVPVGICDGSGTCTAGVCLRFTDGTDVFCAPLSSVCKCASVACPDGTCAACALACPVNSGEQVKMTFASTTIPLLMDATEPPSPYRPTIVINGNLNETCDPDDIDVNPANEGIGDKVSESGWIEIER